jgi:hypothetical protein
LNNPRRKRRHLRVAGVPVAAALAAWGQGLAGAEWSATPRASVTSEINSNPRLTTADHTTSFGLITDVGVVLRRATEINTLEFEPRVRPVRYLGEDNLDSDNYSFRFGADHKFERGALGFDATYGRSSTLATELETTGLVQNQLAVDNVSLGPSLSYQITERDQVDLAFTYGAIDYEEAPGSGLSDYSTTNASITYTHALTEKAQFFSQFSRGGFDVDDIVDDPTDPSNRFDTSSSTTSYTLIGGFQGNTETLTGTAYGGLIHSTRDRRRGSLALAPEESTSGVGSLFTFRLSKRFEQATWSGNYERTVQPTGSGTQQIRNEWGTRLSYDFDERLTGNLGFRYFDNSNQFATLFGFSSAATTFIGGDAGLTYRLTPYLSAFMRYSHLESSNDTSDLTASQNVGQIGLSYSGEKWAVSR